MPRQRTFTFVPYEPVRGRAKDDFTPFVKITKAGQMNFGKETLEKLELNKMVFYKIYVDIGKRSVGLLFSEEKGLTDEWKVWAPKAYELPDGSSKTVKMTVSIGSFLNQLTEVILPSKRLPIGIYEDTDIKQKFHYVRIPYKDETPGGRKMDGWQ